MPAAEIGARGARANAAVTVRPGAVNGTCQAPGSKSVTHRAFLLAAQSTQPCTVRAPLMSADTRATLACLHAMRARFQPEPGAVRFEPAGLAPPAGALDCANSGTTLRLLSATAARLPVPVTLTGDASLRSRPSAALWDALGRLGASVAHKDGKAPVTVRGPLRAGPVTLPPGVSSQFGSALLLSLPMLPGDSTVAMQPPVASGAYLDVTLAVARQAGLRIVAQDAPGRLFRVPGGQAPGAAALDVEGDWSAAAFPLVAAAITGGAVRVRGLRPDSPQGDRAIVSFLRSFGAQAEATADGASVAARQAPLQSPGTVDVSGTPDLFPALAVLAACAQGTTTFTGGAQLRVKESDRIEAMAAGLRRMGASARATPDGLVVSGGGGLKGAGIACLGDHRIHMAFVVAGLAAAGPTTVDDPACAAVSYPGFHQAMAALGAPLA